MWTLVALLSGVATGACTAELGNESGSGEGPSDGTGADTGVPPGGDGDGNGLNEQPPSFEPLGGVDPITCDEAQAGFGTPRIWRLTRRQYDRTVADLVYDETAPGDGFLPEPGSEQGFQNDAYGMRVRATEAGQFNTAAKELATNVVASHLTDIFPCETTQLSDTTCRTSFIETFGARAFRRPLSADEVTRYEALYDTGLSKGDGQLAVTVTVEAMLQSPYFLYRFELGDYDPASPASVTLTQHEIAAALSYYLTEGPPDDALSAAAASGSLASPDARRAQAERLLALKSGEESQIEFYRQLFEYSGLDDVMKDEGVFPEFWDLRDEFHREMEEFVRYAVFEDTGGVATLLGADYTFANQTLGDFLGLSVSGDDFQRVSFDPTQRAGALSLTGFSAAISAQTRTSPVNRGRFVREKLLCEHIDEPPEGVDTNLPSLDPGMSAREQLEIKTSPPACTGCHSIMNPVGFGMESLDALGRFRTEENGLPIDDSGEIIETRDINGPFVGVRELADRLGQSEQVKECFVIQEYRYALGRGENSKDACSISDIRDAFLTAGADLSLLPALIASTETFITRAPE